MVEVGDVKDSNTTESLRTHGVAHALSTAVDATTGFFYRHEEKIFVQRDIALPTGANHRRAKGRMRGIRDIPHLQAVESALKDIVADEPKVTIEESKTSGILRV